ncbi:hypothetical protein AKJ56_00485 [candidate division MSBL1 archaeon SCGC-AAA382N08]|uniref:UPF0251 protein AKJ56_00485 n=1 Tax=candidate division MSBL1 archaeon SCGC-AAA382N08 TaxID=1698285 RepID=A0A133VQJ6_9EURY|nr:hypothetical protein AKJ56_00485 [candidate division MSBL1 archaeon SCGC-AAA382N08]
MPRRRRRRRVGASPKFEVFGPSRDESGSEVILKVEEFEAIRLKDFEGLDQNEAAEKMDISQPTFHRVLVSARQKIADALVGGKTLRVKGGSYEMVSGDLESEMRDSE